MGQTDPQSSLVFGFFTVVRHPQHGLFGGYLVLNRTGRPLEFHCTAPVKTNRAQEILYGPTLEPYLYGEQIGQTLLAKAEARAVVVCTDVPAALAVREHVAIPTVLVLAAAETTDAAGASVDGQRSQPSREGSYRLDAAHGVSRPTHAFSLGAQRLAVASDFADDETRARESLATIVDRFDLAEPFGRIREAIEEAQRSSR
jgi:hypothetical protein